MRPIRSILLHLDATPASAFRLRAALQLADQHDAAVTALYSVVPALMQSPTAYAVAASPDIAPLLAEYDTERRAKARALFDVQAAGRERVHWVESHDEPTRAFARAALCSDLLVLGQRLPTAGLASYAADDVPPDFVESVLLWSGKPGLVVPHIGLPEKFGRVAVLAWKETPESARALTAALPLLQHAEQVHVATWGETPDADSASFPDVQAHLRRHGVTATLHHQGRLTKDSGDVGDLLLSLASDLSADLVVMGCYGHGRAREWVVGGATRTVLASMTVPVLMVH
jgi:nucleotide-binding universal stress UspA family protein